MAAQAASFGLDSAFECSTDAASECGSEASTDAVFNCETDPLTLGQRVLISSSVTVESLRGCVGVVVKQPKRGKRYTVSVRGQKLKSPRRFLELPPSGPKLRELAAEVLYDWLPATAGWVPHEECKDELLLDFIDAVKAMEAGERPTPLNTKLGTRLSAIQESDEEPSDAMAGIMAGAYLDLPNPLCNPWQRDLLWPYACPNAKLKYRTGLEKLMSHFAAMQNDGRDSTAASSSAPIPVGSPKRVGAESTTLTKPASDTPVTHCVVCLGESSERSIDWIFNDCGHCCLCKPCVRKLHDKAASDLIECPLCRCVSTVVPSRLYKGKVFYAM